MLCVLCFMLTSLALIIYGDELRESQVAVDQGRIDRPSNNRNKRQQQHQHISINTPAFLITKPSTQVKQNGMRKQIYFVLFWY